MKSKEEFGPKLTSVIFERKVSPMTRENPDPNAMSMNPMK
jgi:hypothetical protein